MDIQPIKVSGETTKFAELAAALDRRLALASMSGIDLQALHEVATRMSAATALSYSSVVDHLARLMEPTLPQLRAMEHLGLAQPRKDVRLIRFFGREER